jgi:hypothetical protein
MITDEQCLCSQKGGGEEKTLCLTTEPQVRTDGVSTEESMDLELTRCRRGACLEKL